MGTESIRDGWWRHKPRARLKNQILYLTFFSVVTWLSIHWLLDALPLYYPRDWAKAHEFDGLIDWKAARLFLVGRSPFAPEGLEELRVIGFGHPPTASFWFLPFARFEKPVAAELLSLSTWLFLGIHLYILGRELNVKAPLLWSVLLFSWVLTTQGMVMHWDSIQLSEQIALPLTLAWMYLRRGRDTAAGIMLGIAICLKLFPGLLVGMLLFAGRLRAVVAAGIVFLTASLVMSSVFGWEAWPLFFQQQPAIAEPWIGSVRNASIQGIVLRALVPICEAPAPPSALGSLVAAGISLVLLLLSWFVSRHSLAASRKVDPRAMDLPFALFSVLSVFANAWVWEHYSLLMITSGYIVVVTSWRAFSSTYRAWLDEVASTKKLIIEGFLEALTLLTVLASMKMFSLNIFAKVHLPLLYYRTKLTALHGPMHFFEVISWLPWALMIALCLLLVWYRSPPKGTQPKG